MKKDILEESKCGKHSRTTGIKEHSRTIQNGWNGESILEQYERVELKTVWMQKAF